MSISRLLSLFVALALVVVAALTLRAGVASSNPVNSGTIDAGAARWQALGEAYVTQAQEAARVQRAQAADTARWIAMGKFYAKLEMERIQRTQDAATSRWQALGEFYAKRAQAAQRIQQVQNADAARWQALGEFYARLQVKR